MALRVSTRAWVTVVTTTSLTPTNGLNEAALWISAALVWLKRSEVTLRSPPLILNCFLKLARVTKVDQVLLGARNSLLHTVLLEISQISCSEVASQQSIVSSTTCRREITLTDQAQPSTRPRADLSPKASMGPAVAPIPTVSSSSSQSYFNNRLNRDI